MHLLTDKEGFPCAGSHTLRLGCTLWVYNLTGLPISLRQSVDDPLVLRDAELKMEEDVVGASDPYLPCLR